MHRTLGRVAIALAWAGMAGLAHAQPSVSTPPEVELKPVCKILQRDSNVGTVADSNLLPAYPNSPEGDNQRILASGMVLSSPSASNGKGLLKFTFGPGVIPAGAIIQTAEVVLAPIEMTGHGTVAVHLVTKDWSESTVTSGNFPLATSIQGTPFRSVSFDSHFTRFDVTQQVSDWVSGAVPNYGMLFAMKGPLVGVFSVGSSESESKPYLKFCYVGSPCGGQPDGKACKSRYFCTASGTCQSGVCVGTPSPAGTRCRDSISQCDVAEVCDGVNLKCPANALAPTTRVCRAAAGVCDSEEKCDGNAFECPVDEFRGGSCREAAGDCDVTDYCTEKSATCPANAFKPATHVCRPAGSGDKCDIEEKCNGHSVKCPSDKFKAAGTMCRDAAGECDKAEKCTGSSRDCPANAFKSLTTECRASDGPCDVAEQCPGDSANCPGNSFKSTSTVCLPSTGVCDVDDRCTGSSAACPGNQFAPNNQSCGSSMVCLSGQCKHCGNSNETCCPGASCSGTLTCQGGVCKTCGASGTACCASGRPCIGQAICNAAHVCEPCGKQGQACCNGTYGCFDNNAPCCTDKFSGGKFTCQPSPPGQLCP